MTSRLMDSITQILRDPIWLRKDFKGISEAEYSGYLWSKVGGNHINLSSFLCADGVWV